MIKAFAGATTLIAVLAGPSVAADMPVKARATPAMVVAHSHNWSGLYASLSVGAGWQDIDGVWIDPPPDVHRTSATRGWIGGNIGYQAMWNQVVIGVEASYSAPWDSDYATSTTGPDCINLSLTADRTCQSRIRNIWTVGGKLGYAFNNWMIYAAGGYANGQIDQTVNATSTGAQLSFDTKRHGGWYAGGGIDVLVTRASWWDFILGVEYRHIELSDETHLAQGGTTEKIFNASIDTVMAKATLKWGGSGPYAMPRP
jgi:outer membrane immunogenic protein